MARGLASAALAAVALLSIGCGSRSAIPITSAAVWDDPPTVFVVLQACDPRDVAVAADYEIDPGIVVLDASMTGDSGDDCGSGVVAELSMSIGDRAVVDGATDRPVPYCRAEPPAPSVDPTPAPTVPPATYGPENPPPTPVATPPPVAPAGAAGEPCPVAPRTPADSG